MLGDKVEDSNNSSRKGDAVIVKRRGTVDWNNGQPGARDLVSDRDHSKDKDTERHFVLGYN